MKKWVADHEDQLRLAMILAFIAFVAVTGLFMSSVIYTSVQQCERGNETRAVIRRVVENAYQVRVDETPTPELIEGIRIQKMKVLAQIPDDRSCKFSFFPKLVK